jgi:ElaB/YqjD/DUF883 family membrane-anchored ribosome-binding protein
MAQIKSSVRGSNRPSSTRIRSDIERTRAEMDRTFDALEQKLTPGQIVGEVWHLAKGGSVAGAGKLWQIARDYPMPATVIASGIGLLMWESSRSSRNYDDYEDDRIQDRGYYYDAGRSASYNTDWQADQDEEGRLAAAAGAVKDAASGARDTVAEAASHAREKVSDVAGTVRDRAADLGNRTRERASDLTGRARERASEVGDSARYQAQRARLGFWQMMEENPLGVGIAALAIGALAGLTIPSTRREDELLGETRDRLLDDAKELGREALDKGKQVASTAVETLKEEVRNQGLTPESVVEKVRAVGRETKEAVKEEARKQDLPGIAKPETSGQENLVGEPELARH